MRLPGALARPAMGALLPAPAVPGADDLQRILAPLGVRDGARAVLRQVGLALDAAQRRVPAHGAPAKTDISEAGTPGSDGSRDSGADAAQNARTIVTRWLDFGDELIDAIEESGGDIKLEGSVIS